MHIASISIKVSDFLNCKFNACEICHYMSYSEIKMDKIPTASRHACPLRFPSECRGNMFAN